VQIKCLGAQAKDQTLDYLRLHLVADKDGDGDNVPSEDKEYLRTFEEEDA